MNYIQRLQVAMSNVENEKKIKEDQLKQLEEDFSNVKLNPYGITSVDFAKRQDLSSDLLKIEGVLMGLTLAIETFGESEGATV
jgi:hypothetical protein